VKPEQAIKVIDKKINRIKQAIEKDIPRLVGKHAVDFYRSSFEKGGFQNGTLKKWTPAKRLGTIKGADGKYGTLLSRRKELHNSIHFIPGVGKVTIRSDKPYSRIHNEGGNIVVPVTAKMKKFAWAKHYQTVGKGSEEFSPWKGLALTKKKQLHIAIPRRQFMGSSTDLNNILNTKVSEYVNKIFKE